MRMKKEEEEEEESFVRAKEEEEEDEEGGNGLMERERGGRDTGDKTERRRDGRTLSVPWLTHFSSLPVSPSAVSFPLSLSSLSLSIKPFPPSFLPPLPPRSTAD